MSKLKGATGLLLATLMVSCSGGGLIPTTEVEDEEETTIPGEEITITVELPYPQGVDIHIGIPGVTVTCTVGCEGKQTEVTDDQGVVTFTGNIPLTVRAEKTGYIPAERVVSDGSLVAMGHEWPPEAESVIRQLGLADAIASGELFLIWGDTVFIEAVIGETGNEDIGAVFSCPTIVVKQFPSRRNFMVRILAHEAMHAWQGRHSMNPPCDLHNGYTQSEEGKAWAEAWEQDIAENGNFSGIDGEFWADTILENQAEIYSYWWLWGHTPLLEGNNESRMQELCQVAPRRCRYMADRFGSPPPR